MPIEGAGLIYRSILLVTFHLLGDKSTLRDLPGLPFFFSLSLFLNLEPCTW